MALPSGLSRAFSLCASMHMWTRAYNLFCFLLYLVYLPRLPRHLAFLLQHIIVEQPLSKPIDFEIYSVVFLKVHELFW